MNLFFYKALKKRIWYNKIEILYFFYKIFKIRYSYLKDTHLTYNINNLEELLIYCQNNIIFRQLCILTKRSRSSSKLLGLSRFKIKEFFGIGLIPNLKKKSW